MYGVEWMGTLGKEDVVIKVLDESNGIGDAFLLNGDGPGMIDGAEAGCLPPLHTPHPTPPTHTHTRAPPVPSPLSAGPMKRCLPPCGSHPGGGEVSLLAVGVPAHERADPRVDPARGGAGTATTHHHPPSPPPITTTHHPPPSSFR